MLLYTAPTPCTFDGSTTDAQSYCTCPCSISWDLAAALPNCTNSPAQNCPAAPHVHHPCVSGCSLFLFLKPLPLEPYALDVTLLFCPSSAIPPSSTGSSSHAAAARPTARVFALHFEARRIASIAPEKQLCSDFGRSLLGCCFTAPSRCPPRLGTLSSKLQKNSSKNIFVQNHFIQNRRQFHPRHFHPKTGSSNDTFIQKRFRPMTFSPKKRFHPMTVSSQTIFIQP